ncbi:AP-1 complex-associated regulatory protein [Tupaia chinensis]|uniref:AP-1 complex-associated regulatory protein n=1 Tax=Tupaia chinensis TaxID=246437 RepID=UPI000FFB1E5F|nr:AP-1 complex-associated regulatory protein [Tupaia chinensis]
MFSDPGSRHADRRYPHGLSTVSACSCVDLSILEHAREMQVLEVDTVTSVTPSSTVAPTTAGSSVPTPSAALGDSHEHLFENLVESDEGESPGSSHRPLTEEEIVDLRERRYDSIAEKQKDLDERIQKEGEMQQIPLGSPVLRAWWLSWTVREMELRPCTGLHRKGTPGLQLARGPCCDRLTEDTGLLASQEEELRLEEEASYAAQRAAARAAKQRKRAEQERRRAVQQSHPASSGAWPSSGPEDDFESCLRNVKSQYEVFRSSRLSSDATVLTPNTESSCDLMTKTKSTSGNDDSTSLDLEWEDEEGMSRTLPVRERSRTEEDILRAALRPTGRRAGSQAASASDDSNGLEWESDFVGADVDANGNSEYSADAQVRGRGECQVQVLGCFQGGPGHTYTLSELQVWKAAATRSPQTVWVSKPAAAPGHGRTVVGSLRALSAPGTSGAACSQHGSVETVTSVPKENHGPVGI